MANPAPMFLHLVALALNAFILWTTWPIADIRVLAVVVAAFFVSFVIFARFSGVGAAHAGGAAMHALSVGALLLLPAPIAGGAAFLLFLAGAFR